MAAPPSSARRTTRSRRWSASCERSGGFGGVLALAHEWAPTEATLRSYELWARYVAPRFQGQIDTIEANRDWIEERQGAVFGPGTAAYVKAFEDAGKEMPQQMKDALAAARNRTRQ